jgi:hypothetical protein
MNFNNCRARLSVRSWSIVLAATLSTFASAGRTAVDQNISIAFAPSANGNQISWLIAGAAQDSWGGTLGPFNRACAAVQGTPTITNNVVTRSIYILDAGNGGADVPALYVYDRTDVLTKKNGQSIDSVSIVLNVSVDLPLVSSPSATCYMAANDSTVYVGTTADIYPVSIGKATLKPHQIPFGTGSWSTSDQVSSITASDEGVIVIGWGGPGTQDPDCTSECQWRAFTGAERLWFGIFEPMFVFGSTNGASF